MCNEVHRVHNTILVLVSGLMVSYKGKPHVSQMQIFCRATFMFVTYL